MTNTKDISPIAAAKAATPWWMMTIRTFDALEIQPCAVVGHDLTGKEIMEPCEPEEAAVWTVYGHHRAGGVEAFEYFPDETKARSFHNRLLKAYPHLAPK